jgi:hypothetical protein
MHSYLYSWQRLQGFPEVRDRHRWGRYEDEFVCLDDGWRQSALLMLVAGHVTELAPREGEVTGRPVWPWRQPTD